MDKTRRNNKMDKTSLKFALETASGLIEYEANWYEEEQPEEFTHKELQALVNNLYAISEKLLTQAKKLP